MLEALEDPALDEEPLPTPEQDFGFLCPAPDTNSISSNDKTRMMHS
jgi:hypothetical protein